MLIQGSKWLSDVEITQKITNESGCVCNEIVFTAENGNKLCLTLFDVEPINAEDLDESFYRAAEETLAGLPSGFPMINSIMYTVEAAEKCGVKPD